MLLFARRPTSKIKRAHIDMICGSAVLRGMDPVLAEVGSVSCKGARVTRLEGVFRATWILGGSALPHSRSYPDEELTGVPPTKKAHGGKDTQGPIICYHTSNPSGLVTR